MDYKCEEYIQTSEKGGSLSIKNSCLKCGRTKEAHRPEKGVNLVFQGRTWNFNTYEEARVKGFYVENSKPEDFGRLKL